MQDVGLQTAYNDLADREVKMAIHKMLALAYVPVDDVDEVFEMLNAEVPDEVLPVFEYFNENYIEGRVVRARGRGGRRTIPPRYPINIWNQHEAALAGYHKTNNVSEGWHNRFRLVIGKVHPDLYSALKELQKEQADTEIIIAELSLEEE